RLRKATIPGRQPVSPCAGRPPDSRGRSWRPRNFHGMGSRRRPAPRSRLPIRGETTAMEDARILLARLERALATLDALGDAVIVTDPQGHIASLNAAAESLTGWPRTEAAGRPLLQTISLLDEHTRRPFDDPVARTVAGGAEAPPPRDAL